jgi:hypothetical protein
MLNYIQGFLLHVGEHSPVSFNPLEQPVPHALVFGENDRIIQDKLMLSIIKNYLE